MTYWLLVILIAAVIWIGSRILWFLEQIWTEIGKNRAILEHIHEKHLHDKSQM